MAENRDRGTGAQEWGDIFRQIEDQVRREAARLASLEENADWDDIGKGYSEAARKQAAKSVGLDEAADWKSIGKGIEQSARSGAAKVVGEQADTDWKSIGQNIDERLQKFFNDLFSPKPRTAAKEKGEDELGPEDKPVDPWA